MKTVKITLQIMAIIIAVLAIVLTFLLNSNLPIIIVGVAVILLGANYFIKKQTNPNLLNVSIVVVVFSAVFPFIYPLISMSEVDDDREFNQKIIQHEQKSVDLINQSVDTVAAEGNSKNTGTEKMVAPASAEGGLAAPTIQ